MQYCVLISRENSVNVIPSFNRDDSRGTIFEFLELAYYGPSQNDLFPYNGPSQNQIQQSI
jgi:hypothetical protein